MEKIEGDYAPLVDLPECEAALGRLHGMGFFRGDANNGSCGDD
jgi:hypothetical protein